MYIWVFLRNIVRFSSIHSILKFLEYLSVVILRLVHCLLRELEAVNLGSTCRIHGSPAATAAPPPQLPTEESVDALCNTLHHWHHCPELYKAIEGIRFIADHTKREEDSTRVITISYNSDNNAVFRYMYCIKYNVYTPPPPKRFFIGYPRKIRII